MRKTGLVVILILVAVSLVFGAVTTNLDAPREYLKDYLLTPPNSIYDRFGYSEETLLLWNIISLKEACVGYEARIAELVVKVAALEVIDVDAEGITIMPSQPPVVDPVDVPESLDK